MWVFTPYGARAAAGNASAQVIRTVRAGGVAGAATGDAAAGADMPDAFGKPFSELPPEAQRRLLSEPAGILDDKADAVGAADPHLTES